MSVGLLVCRGRKGQRERLERLERQAWLDLRGDVSRGLERGDFVCGDGCCVVWGDNIFRHGGEYGFGAGPVSGRVVGTGTGECRAYGACG